jgi:hypothetical protein
MTSLFMNPAECGPVNDLKSLGGRLDVDGRARRVSSKGTASKDTPIESLKFTVMEIIGRLRYEHSVWGCRTVETNSSGGRGVKVFGTRSDELTPFIAIPH